MKKKSKIDYHTPEPWKVEQVSNTFFIDPVNLNSRSNQSILKMIGNIQDVNANRIVAAVNACAGIPTDMLEEGIIGKAIADFEMMQEAEKIMLKTLAELRLENLHLKILAEKNKPTIPQLFIGTETGIEDIDKAPSEPDYDNQAKDYDEDRRWEGSPTEYDM